ncbi:MAG: hypothetical protein JW883_16905 [Deltaproteobacteria bacterium]|nr:hypothetical protein [Deltaproteobacteria bacterium]
MMNNKGLRVGLWAVILLLAATTWVRCVPRGKLYGVKKNTISLEKPRTLALLKFYGPDGAAVRRRICDRLAGVQHLRPIDCFQYPDVEGVTFDKLGDPDSTASLEALEADGAITGRVIAFVQDNPGADQVEVKEGTGHYKKKKNIDGQWVDVEIKRVLIRPLPHVVRKASLTMEYKVLDLNAKGIIATGKFTESCEEKFGGCKEYVSMGHRLSDLPAPSVTVEKLSARLAGKMVEKLSRIRLSGAVK